jgi:hypothetical protein
MSLASILTQVISAIGADIKQLRDAGTTNLVEYTDADPAEAAVGAQWVRKNSVVEGQLVALVGGVPVVCQEPTVSVRTKTSWGVV